MEMTAPPPAKTGKRMEEKLKIAAMNKQQVTVT
jgi:hypothetical protein